MNNPEGFHRYVLFALIVGVALLGALAAWSLLQKRSTPLANSMDENVSRVYQERERLSKEVWKKEEEAQAHEMPFVYLWDDLRNKADKFAVLKNFAFDELRLGKQGGVESHDNGIQKISYAGTGEILNHDQWQTWLETLKKQNFILLQCEFHHSNFSRKPDGKASSTMASVFHVINTRTGKRYIAKGNLEIEWRPRKDSRGEYVCRVIDASNFSILERGGNGIFKEIKQLSLTSGFARPVLAYDLDGDGLSEIILPDQNLVHWNKGKGRFKPEKMFSFVLKDPTAAVIADFNGDGCPDLVYAGHTEPSDRLRPNEDEILLMLPGDRTGHFTKRPIRISSPDCDLKAADAIAAGDIDGDGDLDLFVAQYKSPYIQGQMPTPYYDANDGFASYLLVNQGNEKFADKTEEAGLAPKRFRRTFSTSFVDLDDDGDLDLMVVSDYSGIDLYLNDGLGHFTDVTDRDVDNRTLFGMSHTLGDYNLDGKMDMYVVGMSSTTARRLDNMGLVRKEFPEHNKMRKEMGYGNRMYLGTADHAFKQFAGNDQVARTGWSWGCTSFDFDNDGDLDLYIANGHVSSKSAKDYCTTFWCHDIYTGSSQPNHLLDEFFFVNLGKTQEQGISWNGFEHNNLFMNESGKQFMNISFLLDAALEGDCLNVIGDDLDADGKPDLLVGEATFYTHTHRLHILQNNWPGTHHWIGVNLREEGRGFSPIGARITVVSPSHKQEARIVTGDSHNSQHSNTKHFGLGADERVEYIEVKWLNGKVKRIDHPKINQYHSVKP